LQKSQKEYEKELDLQNKQKEQKENIAKQDEAANNVVPALPNIPVNIEKAGVAQAALPVPTRAAVPAAVPAVPAVGLQKKKELMAGGAFFDSDFNDSRDRLFERERGIMGANPGITERIGMGTDFGKTTTSSGKSNLLTRALPDSEPFIASLVKFNNSGFPNNVTIPARIDTFFNINLFKAFLKKLGEPVKLYGNDNQVVSVDDIGGLNLDKEQQKNDKSNSKNKVYETDQKTEGNYITNWYPAQEQNKLIGSAYAFIYTRPTEQEVKQQAELNKKIPSASMLMIKEGDNYRLIGGPVDNKVKIFTGFSGSSTVSSDKYNTETSERTVESQINDFFKRVTGQSYLPQSVSNTGRRFVYEPESSFSKKVDAKSDVKDLKSVIYSRQVTNSQIESIIESSRASSTDIVKVPITTLFNILNGKTQTLQTKIDMTDQTRTILKFLFRILEKQNLLSTISGQQKKKVGEIYENRIEKLREKLSESSLNELDSIIRHNIRFILDILFSSKTVFKYKGISYIIDYLEWNNTFKQLNKVLENYKVAYYIELQLFLEKIEKGKLPIDRDGTLFSSCVVRGAQLKNLWKRNFLEQNWSRVGKQIKNSITIKQTPSITDILPGFIKRALDVGSSQLMSQLNSGVNQISLVQYCFLGQEQLIEDFKSIDNSFAGVSWKNENSWSKRKELLFAAMDNCGSDVYCFQNVQCSIEAYSTIVSSLTDSEKEKLQDITQIERIKIHRKVLDQLLEKKEDPLNLIAQIYERYKDRYVFVYFFEQNVYGDELSNEGKKTALGNLTMFKSDKFELKDEADIRIAPFIRKNKRRIETIDSIDPIYNNTSFATIVYCKFKGGKYRNPSLLPGQMPGQIPRIIETIKINNVDDTTIPEENESRESVQPIKDYEEEGTVEQPIVNYSPSVSPSPSPAPDRKVAAQGGGDGSDSDEWYNKDNSEEVGFMSGLFGNAGTGKQGKVKTEAEPCKKYMNEGYIPSGQIFGIINIKLETAETLRQIESKQAAKAMQVTKSKPSKPATTDKPATETTGSKKITKQMLEVLLIAAFVSKFRTRYYLSSSTDINPYFMTGDFNFDIPYDQPIGKGTIREVYLKAPAFALLLTRSNNVFTPADYPSVAAYAKEISDFIYKTCKILTYLYGGKGKNGRLRLIGYTNSQTLPNMFGYKYSLTNLEKINKSELIFTTGKLLLCPKEEMHKIVNSESPEGLPSFPNKSNPSNCDAIGGVFELDTEYVNLVIQAEEKNSIRVQQSQEASFKDEARRSIIEEATGRQIRPMSSTVVSSPMSSPLRRPVSPSKPIATTPPLPEVEEKEVPDLMQSSSGKTAAESVGLVPEAISITGEELTKLHNFDYTASKQNTFKGSPYKKSVVICETGKPEYKYLTEIEMKNWSENKEKLFSDHSPVMYKVNNSGNKQCGPLVAVSDTSLGTGASLEGGVMEGGAFPAEINVITWNVAGYGSEGLDKSSGKSFYFHKFTGNVKEDIDHYKSRLTNNAKAIIDMVNSGYDYLLVQEGPNSSLEKNLNIGQDEPFNYKNLFTSTITSNANLGVIPSLIQDNDKYYSEFYIVVNKKTIQTEDINSLGFLIVGQRNYFSNDEAAIIFRDLISSLISKKIENYEETSIKKDFARLWFFVNSKNKQIITSVHLQLDEKNTPKMYQRQQQVYILLNTVVSYFRQSATYKDFNIVFTGDFNINMLQPFPTDVLPTFLKCDSVPGQQTFIYTSKNNAPSSFGGDNEGKYNPTNIDFALFYPKPTTKKVAFSSATAISSASAMVSSSVSVPSSSAPSASMVMESKTKVNNITYYIEQEIFNALPVTPPATNLLNGSVSVVKTYYNMSFANSNIMPPGSATLINIGGSPLNNIVYNHPQATTAKPSGVTVQYMIQASPGKSGSGALISRDVLSNSVMNSLILAAINKVEYIIFPFIGGEIFYKELERVEIKEGRTHSKNKHAEILVKGVTDFYNFIDTAKSGLTSTIKEIYFSPWGEIEKNALIDAKHRASGTKKILDSVLKVSSGTKTLIDETIDLIQKGTHINAIVNAANVELSFGSGISSMCYAAIGKNGPDKQKELRNIRDMFISAFKKYIKQKNSDSGTSGTISLLKKIDDSGIMKLETPGGYVMASGDIYDFYSMDEKKQFVNNKVKDLKWNNFYNTKESGSFIKYIPMGTLLFYYDIKKKDFKNNYIKCWFSFNIDGSILSSKSSISNIFLLNALNPLGNEGNIVWLDSSKVKLVPFNNADKELVTKTVNFIKTNSEESDLLSKKFFIKSSLSAYDSGKYELDEIRKNTLIKLAKEVLAKDVSYVFPDIKDWPLKKKVSSSSTSSSTSVPAPGTLSSSSVSSSKKPSVKEINGINRRATTKEFIDAQDKGIKGGEKIPGGVNDSITYHVTGSTFEEALAEIKAGKKKSHWMWYIFPSDIQGQTPCSTFFKLGPIASKDALGSKKTITIKEYLNDNKLRLNYISITEALYDKLDEILDRDEGNLPQQNLKYIMTTSTDSKNRVDYYKLQNSIKNFYLPLKAKLKSLPGYDSEQFIKKMNYLNAVLNDIKDPEYKLQNEDEVEDGYLETFDEDAGDEDAGGEDYTEPKIPPGSPVSIGSSESSETSSSLSPGPPSTPASPAASLDTPADSPDTPAASLDTPAASLDTPMSPASPSSKLRLKTTYKSRILSLDDILKIMIKNIDKNVFIINGGSFNPPHNGHIKMFKTAYDALVERESSADGEKPLGYYGIMVVSTRKYIMSKGKDEGKGLKYNEVLSSEDRIRLCKLACDTYDWGEDSKFNSNNMLILDIADSDPKALLLHKIVKILDANPAYKDKEKEKEIIKTLRLFYLCGSDFFIKLYSDSSRYSIIYVVRQSEQEKIKKKQKDVESYSNTKYLKIGIDIKDSDVYSLSSTIVRDEILRLGTPLLSYKLKNLQDAVIKSIGLPVYCYLRELQYLIPKKHYGKKCDDIDDALSEEIESVHDSEISAHEGIDEDVDTFNDEELGDYLIDLHAGELDDIPENDRNIFIDVNTFSTFDSKTINNEAEFDKHIDDLINCETYSKKGINLKRIKDFLTRIYQSRLYYILNDLCYFKLFKIDSKYCFIENLFSSGDTSTNLLEGINLLSKDKFNTIYLTGDGAEALQLIGDKENFLDKVKSSGYINYEGIVIDEELADDILGFLYDSERYSIYLYLINPSTPNEAKRILLSLYSTIIEEKNDKVKYIVDNLNEQLTSTFQKSKEDKDSLIISKKLKGPKGSKAPKGPQGAKGETDLLKEVKFVKQRSNGDGNCFYNSIGILSSDYLKSKATFDDYNSKRIREKYKIQFKEQSRVRKALSDFMIRIYNIIKGIDKGSKIYLNSPVIKYIVRNGTNNFKYVRTIRSPVGRKYYGSDEEIYFASLLYRQPIVTVIGVSDVTVFNIFYWDRYDIGGVDFNDYISQPESAINMESVLKFIDDSNQQLSCNVDDISAFMLYYPNSYFLVGGRGHWSYAVNNAKLIKDGSTSDDDSAASFSTASSADLGTPDSVGGNNKYNIRLTKKVKNKYYQKSSAKKGTKKRKMTKKHIKKKEYKKGNKKTIKHM
jgi:nicotinic acid mononucleotide adenylyltransferase